MFADRGDTNRRVEVRGYRSGVELAALQDVIERTYGERDRARGIPSTVAWLAEELGELAQAVRKGTPGRAGARVRRRAGLGGDARQPARHRPDGRRRPLRRRLPALRRPPVRLPDLARRAVLGGHPLRLPQGSATQNGRRDERPRIERRGARSSGRNSSAIWTALRAAPLRRLSLLTNRARPRPSGTPGSLADAADVARVLAGRVERGRDVAEHDAGRRGEQLEWPARPTAAGRTRR